MKKIGRTRKETRSLNNDDIKTRKLNSSMLHTPKKKDFGKYHRFLAFFENKGLNILVVTLYSAIIGTLREKR